MATEATDIAQTHPYTCSACAIAFRNSDAQRTHMRTDWHRYNLKRKVAELPPVSSEDYNQKVLAAQATTNAAAAQASFARTCTLCQRTYYSENAFLNHINSKAHKLKGRSSSSEVTSLASPTISKQESSSTHEEPDPEADAEFERVVAGLKKTNLTGQDLEDSERPSAPTPEAPAPKEHPLSPIKPGPIPLSQCLFCNYQSPAVKLNVSHMSKIHGLFIPEQTYLVDQEGLLGYLQAKVHENHECLCCHKLRNTAAGVQTHMRDTGHCKIGFETEEEMIEIGQFYDFSSTYSDPEAEDSDAEMDDVKPKANGGVKLPDNEDEAWETDSSFSSLDSDELTSVPNDDRTGSIQRLPLSRHHSHTDGRPHRTADGFHSHAHHHNNAVFYDDFEMHLPSGRVAGHRSMQKYYRQNLHSYPTVAERAQQLLEEGPAEEDEEMQDADAPANTQANGRTQAVARRNDLGMIGVSESAKREVRAQEIRNRQKEQHQRNRYNAKVERKNNFQKHFRDQMLQ